MKPTIIIHVEDGVVQGVVADQPVDYIIADGDTEGAEKVWRVPDTYAVASGVKAIHPPHIIGADLKPEAVKDFQNKMQP